MANIKLILLQDVESLGLAGTEVNVAPGYGRNYLIPQGLATKADRGTLRVLEARKEKIEQQRTDLLQRAKDLAAKLAETEVTLVVQASDDGRLYGSITARNITDQLAKQDIKIDPLRLKLDEAIRAVGEFSVDVKLHNEVTGAIKVQISAA
jgi:large subunit ribosomal protein L9